MIKPRRSKDPKGTKDRLLSAAFDHFQRQGYHATAVRDVLAGAKITSGALFHHFNSKQALAVAVLEGPVSATIEQWWVTPLDQYPTAFAAVRATLAKLEESMVESERRLGCPLGNAAAELVNEDPAFEVAIRDIFERWHEALADRIKKDQADGYVSPDVDPSALATFVIVGVEGAIALTKAFQSVEPVRQYADQLARYFRGLETSKP